MSEEKPDTPTGPFDGAQEPPPPPAAPLFLVKGDATPEEVAALTVVLQGVAAANAPAPERKVTSEWSAHHRKVRSWHSAGSAGWRSSSLPR